MIELNNDFYKKGLFYLENNDSLKALEYFKKIEPLFSDNAILMNDIGTAYGHLGMSEKSVFYLEKAILLDKTLGMAFYNMGIHYLETENFNKALEYFSTAIKNDCKDIWNCYYMRANTYYTYTATSQRGLNVQAIDDILEAIKLCPYPDADMFLIAGILFKIIENYDIARFYLNKAALLGDIDAKKILSTL